MGAAIGTGDKKSVNVELNIVPFIDLMSCLTAFLLVTAVWVNIAQINNHSMHARCITITHMLATEILAHPNHYYVVVSDAKHPHGAVRGQL